jgi:hypothetical protein
VALAQIPPCRTVNGALFVARVLGLIHSVIAATISAWNRAHFFVIWGNIAERTGDSNLLQISLNLFQIRWRNGGKTPSAVPPVTICSIPG